MNRVTLLAGVLLICAAGVTAGVVSAGGPSEEAMRMFRLGHYEDALQMLSDHLDSNMDDLNAQVTYCILRSEMGEGEAVRKDYQALAAEHPDNRGIELAAIVAMPQSLGKLGAFSKFTKGNPDLARGFEEYGRCAIDTYRPHLAIEPLERAIEIEPSRARAHLLLGLAHRAMENGPGEEAEIARAYEISPDDPTTCLEWAATQLSRGEHETAVQILEPLVDVVPNDAYIPALLAVAKKEGGDDDGWAEYKAVAMRRNPTLLEGMTSAGLSLRNAGQMAEAERVMLYAIALDDQHLEAYLQLGILYRAVGNTESAIEIYTRATQVREGALNQLAWRNLGLSYGDNGDLATSEKYIRKSLEVDPDYLIGWVDLARVLGYQAKIDEAKDVWGKVISMAPYGWEAKEGRETLIHLDQGEVPPMKTVNMGNLKEQFEAVRKKLEAEREKK